MMGWVADRRSLQAAFVLPVIAMGVSAAILFYGMKFAPAVAVDGERAAQPRTTRSRTKLMVYFHWIAGIILALAWASRIVDAAIGMPSVADVSRPEWDRNPALPSGNPRVSIIVPARNEEETIEQALTSLLSLDYDNYEVIAVNDRSTDHTGEIMEKVASLHTLNMSGEAIGSKTSRGPSHRTASGLAGEDPCNVDRRERRFGRLAALHRR